MVKGSRFNYQRRTAEDFRSNKGLSRGGGFDSWIKQGFKKYKMRDGKNHVRFLPPTWEFSDQHPNHFAYVVWLNWDIGPDKQKYLSLWKMKGLKDPIAEARNAASNKGDKDTAKALNPSRRFVAWVIDRMAEEEGPQLLDFPGKLNDAIQTASEDEDTGEIIYIDDPDKGGDVRFYKEGSGKTGTEYPGEKVKVLKPSPLSEDGALADEWCQYVTANPISKVLQFYDYDHIASVFNGATSAEDEEPTDKVVQFRKTETKPWEEDDEDDRKAPGPSPAPAENSDAKPRDAASAIRERLRRRSAELQEDE